MANPQPDKYTRLSNELIEVIPLFKFNGSQLRIILVILRYTYGFNRKSCRISLSFISNATGIHRTQVKKELDFLIDAKVIKVKEKSDFNNPRDLSFNKNYDEWTLLRCKQACSQYANMLTVVNEETNTTDVGNLGDNPNTEEPKKEEPKKDDSVKDIYITIFEHYNSKNIIKHKKLTEEMKKDINKALKEHTEEEIKKAIDRYAEAYHDSSYEYCKYLWSIHEFMTRKEGYKRFLDDGSKWLNYLKHKNQKQEGSNNGTYKGSNKSGYDCSKLMYKSEPGDTDDSAEDI